MEGEDNTSPTTAKTLWTETILEVLYLALEYDRPDEDVKKILHQMQGCKPAYIIRKAGDKLGQEAAARVKALLSE
jgi:hypothetical protein